MFNNKIVDLRNLSWSKTRQSSGSAGSFLKSYDYYHGQKKYYKLSNFISNDGIFGYESINEFIACRLLTKLNYNHLEYNLENAVIKIDGKDYQTYLCSSLDFKKINESKITLEVFYELNKQPSESIIDFMTRFNMINGLYEIIIIDFLINNKDRHGANIEILFNSKTKQYRLAPIFDNGLSFISPLYKKEDIKKYDVNKELKVNNIISSSLKSNLNLVPTKKLPIIDFDISEILADLYDFIDNDYLNKAKELLESRIDYLENLRNQR